MKAFVVNDTTQSNPIDNGKLCTDVPTPTIPSSSYALVKILRAGICNTDLEILQGYMGFKGILGHEFVGRVIELHEEATDEIKEAWLQKRVCGDINLGCCNFTPPPECGVCNDTLGYNNTNNIQMSRNHCPNRTVLGILNQNGTFCEFMILPIRNLHVVPDGIPNDIAVFAEPLAAACRVVEQQCLVNFQCTDSTGGDLVAILGDGKLGLCIAEVLGREYLRHNGSGNNEATTKLPHPPTLFGKHHDKLALVQNSGVQTQLVSTCYTNDKQDEISANYMNRYDVVIDATGSPNGLTMAMSLCRPMGKLVLKSTCAAGVKGFHSAPIVIDEISVVGSRCGPIDVALQLLEKNSVEASQNGGIPPLRMEKYITKTFPLSQAREALEFAALKTTMKVQLVMTEEE